MRILLVEDDESIATTLTDALIEQRYVVDVAIDGLMGLEMVEAVDYDLILLDMMLPKLDGLSLCRRLRSQSHRMPILLLTSRDTSTDKVLGLDAGADDYVVKPFDLLELSARIRALLRRGEVPSVPILQWGGLSLDPQTCQVSYEGQLLHVSPKEYALLELFLRNNRRVFSRSAILDHLWSFDDSPGEDTVKAHIKGLRQKLKTVGAAELIETVYGLGYRLKPIAESETSILRKSLEVKETTTQPGSEPDSSRKSNAIAAKQAQTRLAVAQTWEKFRVGIFNRVVLLEDVVKALEEGRFNEELRRQGEREAHKLAGSVGMFGFTRGTEISRQLEQLFQADISLEQAQRTQIAELVRVLRQELESDPTVPAEMTMPVAESDLSPDRRNTPFLLIVDDDVELANLIAQETVATGIRAKVASNPLVARDLITHDRPDIVLLDLSFPDTAETGLAFLAELTSYTPAIPVLVFTARDGFTDRVAVARMGGRMFLHKPIAPSTVMGVVNQVLQHTRTRMTRLIAVDDDPQILTVLQTLLEPWGFHSTPLNDSTQFWQTLELVRPELVILDVDMPQLDGIELCQVLRNDPRWGWLPVLFLTAHTDPQTIQRVFAAGADDYISKPVTGVELITRINNRLERTKLLRSLAEKDVLTGTANQQRGGQELTRFLQWAKHYNDPLCLAAIRLDQFKQINEQEGYSVGDQILQRLGKLLNQAFRGEDLVARWAGATFVIGMYGMTRRDGVERLAEVLEILQQEEFIGTSGRAFQMSLSGGVAEYPTDGTDLQTLYPAAIAALEQAQASGGTRIRPVGWQPPKQPATTVDVLLIDNDIVLSNQLLQALERRSYQTEWLQSAEIIMTPANPPLPIAKVTLLNVALPGLDSLKWLKRNTQKKNRPGRTIVLLSQSDQASEFLLLGAYDYIVRPFTLPVLLQRIRRALEA